MAQHKEIEFRIIDECRPAREDSLRQLARFVKLFNNSKRGRRLTQPELHAVRIATIRETPAHEAARRFDQLKAERAAGLR